MPSDWRCAAATGNCSSSTASATAPRCGPGRACPGCGAMIELQFAVDDLLHALAEPVRGELSLTSGEYELELRLPTVGDVTRARSAGELERAAATLAAACVSACLRDGLEVSPDAVPAAVLDE